MNIRPKTYALAFWELLEKADMKDASQTLQFLATFAVLYRNEKNVRDFFKNPRVDLKHKKKAAIGYCVACEQKAAALLLNILLENNHLNALPTIIEVLRERMNERFGILDVHVTSNLKLSDEQLKEAESRLLQVFDAKHVEWDQDVDESVLGGVVLNVNGMRLDNSLKTKLQQVENNLIQK